MRTQTENLPAGVFPDDPFLEKLGVTLVEWREGYVEMRLPLRPDLLNRGGVLHGGVICSLLDAVAGYAGLYVPPGQPPRNGVTLSLTTNFLASAPGRTLTGIGRLEKQGGRIYFPRAEVWLDDETLIATAMATFRYLG